jgi:sirohydrochlorin ferrochelatase
MKPPVHLLLIAHGSRRAEANAELQEVANALVQRGGYAFVQISFLELTGPSIEEGGRLCVQAGAEEVVMLPYFLSPGVHVREDLVESRGNLSQEFPQVRFLLAEPLGGHPLLLEILEQRAQTVLAN